MSVVIDGTTGITTPAETVQGALTTTGNTILGDASTDTLNVGNGGLVKDASGNVGIGQSTPTANLHVRNTGGNATFKLEYGAGGTISQIIGASSEMSLQAAGASSITAYTNNTERMRIDSSGNVGIGTSSPLGRLALGSLVSSQVLSMYDDGTNWYGFGIASSNYQMSAATGASITFNNITRAGVSTERMRIDSSGNVTMPYQPAFSARMTVVTTTNAAEQKFGTVIFNTGSNYNATTGRFTAPVAGKYYFVFQMLTSNTSARALCYLAKNASSALPAVEASATALNYNSISAFGLFDLAAGDYISVVNASSAEALFYTSPSNQNWFIGYLVG